jgi:threonine/homoserine/homoserine lactone efflux protein
MFLTAEGGRWTPGIGDPSFLGWFTVGAYLVAVALAVVCAVRAHRQRAPIRDRAVWWTIAVVLLLLGINKQLDLQTWVTELARDLAIRQGWYGARRPVQVAFIATVLVLGLVSLALVIWALRSSWRAHLLGIAGLTLLVVFVVVRAASFHKIDELLSRVPGWVFELSGIGCLILHAARHLRRGSLR